MKMTGTEKQIRWAEDIMDSAKSRIAAMRIVAGRTELADAQSDMLDAAEKMTTIIDSLPADAHRIIEVRDNLDNAHLDITLGKLLTQAGHTGISREWLSTEITLAQKA